MGTDTWYTDLSEFDFNEGDEDDDDENTLAIILLKEQLKVKALIHLARKWRKYRNALISSVRDKIHSIMLDKEKFIRYKENIQVKRLQRLAAKQRHVREAFVDYSKE